MMDGTTMPVLEAGRTAEPEAWDLLAGPEWTMPAGWVTALVAMALAACVVAALV